jgi:hypothetical protein
VPSIPAVEQYPTRSEPAVRGRRGNVTPGRWATIKRTIIAVGALDYILKEEVINISMMIPADRPPELPGLDSASTEFSYTYFLERVGIGVKIGMIRGGAVDPSGGFGYSDGSDDTPIWIWFSGADYSGHIALFEDI